MNDKQIARVGERVRRELAQLLEDSGIGIDEIRPESSLIDDLALDSLKFVDLTLALEEAFGLSEFPMQEWVDLEAQKTPPAFTVSALARACAEQLEARNPEVVPA